MFWPEYVLGFMYRRPNRFFFLAFVLAAVPVSGSSAPRSSCEASQSPRTTSTQSFKTKNSGQQNQRSWRKSPNLWIYCYECDAHHRNLMGERRRAWIRMRGGANTQVDEHGLRNEMEDSARSMARKASDVRGRDGTRETNQEVEEVDEESSSSVEYLEEDEARTSEEPVSPKKLEDDQEIMTRMENEASSSARQRPTRPLEDVANGDEEQIKLSVPTQSNNESKSALEIMELGQVVPALIKNGVVFFLGTWVAGKLSPRVEQQVRVARIIYTCYLIFSHVLYMYLRYLIWKSEDDGEMEVPPPPQLKKMMEGIKTGGPEVAAGTTDASASASILSPMVEKLMTSKTPVKAYDMKVVQGMRRGQFWASLLMCYTHLKKGMVKPMILQVSFGLLTLLDSPLFKIYVFGQKAEGQLARPFKKQGLMTTLSGPMEGLAAKAEQARVAAEAASNEGTEADRAAQSDGGDTEDEGSVSEEGDGDESALPNIEILSDDTDETW